MGPARHTEGAGPGDGGDAGAGGEGNGVGMGVGCEAPVAAAGEAVAGGGGEVWQQGGRRERGCQMRSGGVPRRVAARRDAGGGARQGTAAGITSPSQINPEIEGRVH